MKEDRLILLNVEDKAQGSVLNGPDSFILTTSLSYWKCRLPHSYFPKIKDLLNFPKGTFKNWESKWEGKKAREKETSCEKDT